MFSNKWSVSLPLQPHSLSQLLWTLFTRKPQAARSQQAMSFASMFCCQNLVVSLYYTVLCAVANQLSYNCVDITTFWSTAVSVCCSMICGNFALLKFIYSLFVVSVSTSNLLPSSLMFLSMFMIPICFNPQSHLLKTLYNWRYSEHESPGLMWDIRIH